MPSKTHAVTGTVVKTADLTDELKALKGDDADVVAYASVEVEDRDNDVVRVAGISLKNHRPDSPVKLFASHLRTLPNGESPVIGRVVKFSTVTHKGTGKPALAFSAKFAGTPLGKHYAQLYGEGTQTDFSIGFRVDKAEPLGKGLDFKETELMEVSAVALPANEHASVMRAYEETYTKDRFVQTYDADGFAQVSRAPLLSKSDLKDFLDRTNAKFGECLKALAALDSRLDDIESAVEGTKADPEGEPTARTTTPPQTATFDPATLSLLADAIKSLGGK